jgi:hypothetical protein
LLLSFNLLLLLVVPNMSILNLHILLLLEPVICPWLINLKKRFVHFNLIIIFSKILLPFQLLIIKFCLLETIPPHILVISNHLLYFVSYRCLVQLLSKCTFFVTHPYFLNKHDLELNCTAVIWTYLNVKVIRLPNRRIGCEPCLDLFLCSNGGIEHLTWV